MRERELESQRERERDGEREIVFFRKPPLIFCFGCIREAMEKICNVRERALFNHVTCAREGVETLEKRH